MLVVGNREFRVMHSYHDFTTLFGSSRPLEDPEAGAIRGHYPRKAMLLQNLHLQIAPTYANKSEESAMSLLVAF